MYGYGPAPDKMGYHLGAGITAIREAVAQGQPYRAADLLVDLISALPKLDQKRSKELKTKIVTALLSEGDDAPGVRKSVRAEVRQHLLLLTVQDVKEEVLREMATLGVYAWKEARVRDGSSLDRMAGPGVVEHDDEPALGVPVD